jgi:hypothetical protein
MSPAHPARWGGTGRYKDECRGPALDLSIWCPGAPDGPPGVQKVS